MGSVQQSSTLKAALNILRRAPPGDAEIHLSSLQELLSENPDALSELNQHVHLPLQTVTDDGNDEPFLACSWNRLADGTFKSPLSDNDNRIQAHANELWKTYKQLYYGSDAVSSVYVKDESENYTSYCFLLQNKKVDVGEWHSVHIVNVTPDNKTGVTTFLVQSDLLLILGTDIISAHVSKQTTTTTTNSNTPFEYMETIGPILERVETEMRLSLENVHLPKLQNVVSKVRRKNVPKVKTIGMSHTEMLNQAVLARSAVLQNKK